MRLPAVLLVAFSLTLIVGLYAVVAIDTTPNQSTTSTTLLAYGSTTRFDYAASLRPNTLYGNGTLGPGGGALYTSLVTELNLSFAYWLNLSAPANVTFGGGYGLTVAVPGQWTYPLNLSRVDVSPVQGTDSFEFTDRYSVNIPQLLALLTEFENQTGVAQSSYDLNFTAYEVAAIQYGGQPTAQSVTYPVLTFFIAGGQLAPGNLSGTSSGAIVTNVQTTDPSLPTELGLAIAVSIALAVAVGMMAYLTFRPQRRKADLTADLRTMTAPYADAIATTWTAPRKENVVVIRDWEDLVHVADMLGKPILRYVLRKRDPPRHFFYVLDDAIQYIYLVPREGRLAEEEIADLP